MPRGGCAAFHRFYDRVSPRHLLEAGRIKRCIEQAGCARRDARIFANSRQRGTAVRTIKKKASRIEREEARWSQQERKSTPARETDEESS